MIKGARLKYKKRLEGRSISKGSQLGPYSYMGRARAGNRQRVMPKRLVKTVLQELVIVSEMSSVCLDKSPFRKRPYNY